MSYTGVITPVALKVLHAQICAKQKGVTLGLARIDHATTFDGWESAGDNTLTWQAPTAIIVRADQLAASMLFCAKLAKQGVLRMSFLPHEQALAQDWVASCAKLALSDRYTPGRLRV